MNAEIFETPPSTPNFQTELAGKLAELVPEAVTDGKIDVLKLQELLAQDGAETSERFGLFWPGKQRALRIAQMPTTATLKPEPNKSKDWDTTRNVFIEGDNLEVLKILQKHYHGKIKMIYIDPPYNTGKDFVYPDNFKEGLENYLDWTRQVNEEGRKVSTNSETEGRFHSNWLNMMYPRLKLAKNLLTEDGVMFISIGDQEIANLRLICHEIFGEGNYLTTLVWANREGGGGSDSTTFKTKHEYILAISRNINLVQILGEVSLEDESYSHEDEFVESRGRYKLIKLNSFSIQYSPSMDYEIVNDDGSVSVPSENGRRGIWRWSKQKYEWGLQNGFIVKRKNDQGSWTVYTKQYFKVDNNGEAIIRSLPPTALIERHSSTGATKQLTALLGGTKIFDYPKPVQLIDLLQSWVLQEDDLVLDFFSGSGTTGQAIFEANARDGKNRKFILVQLPEPVLEGSEAQKAGFETIAEIARKRINLAASKVGETLGSASLDLGYRAYKLKDSGFAKWGMSDAPNQTVLEQHLFSLRDNALDEESGEVLLTEVLLKLGHSLSEPIESIQVAGLEIISVANGLVLAYMNQGIKPSLEQLRDVLSDSPAKLIILEDAFQGDDELKTNLAQHCKSKNIELWTA